MQHTSLTSINKEIIIDGVIYNKCNGCSLYDGNICTGAKTYEDNAERDKHICDEHLASQFWVVFRQLKDKEQKCQELNKWIESLEEKLSRKKAVVKFADCPCYSYGDNTLEPTCTKNFCYDIKFCDHKDVLKYKQALNEIENYVRDNSDFDKSDKLISNTGAYDILEIINEVKGETNGSSKE